MRSQWAAGLTALLATSASPVTGLVTNSSRISPFPKGSRISHFANSSGISHTAATAVYDLKVWDHIRYEGKGWRIRPNACSKVSDIPHLTEIKSISWGNDEHTCCIFFPVDNCAYPSGGTRVFGDVPDTSVWGMPAIEAVKCYSQGACDVMQQHFCSFDNGCAKRRVQGMCPFESQCPEYQLQPRDWHLWAAPAGHDQVVLGTESIIVTIPTATAEPEPEVVTITAASEISATPTPKSEVDETDLLGFDVPDIEEEPAEPKPTGKSKAPKTQVARVLPKVKAYCHVKWEKFEGKKGEVTTELQEQGLADAVTGAILDNPDWENLLETDPVTACKKLGFKASTLPPRALERLTGLVAHRCRVVHAHATVPEQVEFLAKTVKRAWRKRHDLEHFLDTEPHVACQFIGGWEPLDIPLAVLDRAYVHLTELCIYHDVGADAGARLALARKKMRDVFRDCFRFEELMAEYPRAACGMLELRAQPALESKLEKKRIAVKALEMCQDQYFDLYDDVRMTIHEHLMLEKEIHRQWRADMFFEMRLDMDTQTMCGRIIELGMSHPLRSAKKKPPAVVAAAPHALADDFKTLDKICPLASYSLKMPPKQESESESTDTEDDVEWVDPKIGKAKTKPGKEKTPPGTPPTPELEPEPKPQEQKDEGKHVKFQTDEEYDTVDRIPPYWEIESDDESGVPGKPPKHRLTAEQIWRVKGMLEALKDPSFTLSSEEKKQVRKLEMLLRQNEVPNDPDTANIPNIAPKPKNTPEYGLTPEQKKKAQALSDSLKDPKFKLTPEQKQQAKDLEKLLKQAEENDLTKTLIPDTPTEPEQEKKGDAKGGNRFKLSPEQKQSAIELEELLKQAAEDDLANPLIPDTPEPIVAKPKSAPGADAAAKSGSKPATKPKFKLSPEQKQAALELEELLKEAGKNDLDIPVPPPPPRPIEPVATTAEGARKQLAEFFDSPESDLAGRIEKWTQEHPLVQAKPKDGAKKGEKGGVQPGSAARPPPAKGAMKGGVQPGGVTNPPPVPADGSIVKPPELSVPGDSARKPKYESSFKDRPKKTDKPAGTDSSKSDPKEPSADPAKSSSKEQPYAYDKEYDAPDPLPVDPTWGEFKPTWRGERYKHRPIDESDLKALDELLQAEEGDGNKKVKWRPIKSTKTKYPEYDPITAKKSGTVPPPADSNAVPQSPKKQPPKGDAAEAKPLGPEGMGKTKEKPVVPNKPERFIMEKKKHKSPVQSPGEKTKPSVPDKPKRLQGKPPVKPEDAAPPSPDSGSRGSASQKGGATGHDSPFRLPPFNFPPVALVPLTVPGFPVGFSKGTETPPVDLSDPVMDDLEGAVNDYENLMDALGKLVPSKSQGGADKPPPKFVEPLTPPDSPSEIHSNPWGIESPKQAEEPPKLVLPDPLSPLDFEPAAWLHDSAAGDFTDPHPNPGSPDLKAAHRKGSKPTGEEGKAGKDNTQRAKPHSDPDHLLTPIPAPWHPPEELIMPFPDEGLASLSNPRSDASSDSSAASLPDDPDFKVPGSQLFTPEQMDEFKWKRPPPDVYVDEGPAHHVVKETPLDTIPEEEPGASRGSLFGSRARDPGGDDRVPAPVIDRYPQATDLAKSIEDKVKVPAPKKEQWYNKFLPPYFNKSKDKDMNKGKGKGTKLGRPPKEMDELGYGDFMDKVLPPAHMPPPGHKKRMRRGRRGGSDKIRA